MHPSKPGSDQFPTTNLLLLKLLSSFESFAGKFKKLSSSRFPYYELVRDITCKRISFVVNKYILCCFGFEFHLLDSVARFYLSFAIKSWMDVTGLVGIADLYLPTVKKLSFD